MRISDWSSDVCSSDLLLRAGPTLRPALLLAGTTFGDGTAVRAAALVGIRRRAIEHGAPITIPALTVGPPIIGTAAILAAAFVVHPLPPFRSPASAQPEARPTRPARKSTRLNSSHQCEPR